MISISNDIKNIYCVGRNFTMHAKELNNPVPTSPFLFLKPTHALVRANGEKVVLPSDQGTIRYEMELVIKVSRPYEKGMGVDELIDCIALGIDLTLVDVQNSLKEKGYPWLLAKGFKNSGIITRFFPFPGVEECKQINYSLLINDERVQVGNIKDMIFDLQNIVEFTALNFGLGEGDVIFTGTPEGVGSVSNGDKLELIWGEKIIGESIIELV
ncbi:fumarylacetoacetate hydrolase [Anaerobacillus arseniciselenatis]|uniref:Fumarylacetoacetate hydrolase n=1 Tax=Anaerobacillus arseniciselenatis TaxID=85682 RepID=A0A1S2LNB6_9BACI|nr:fumarylacetoacetate hydrolase family protein [Anaerobacillus arseniciselenatis]OIJ13846.1 fumarylacetoacetate hydrolase [Anaerobacillus arseniciselenatis]